MSFILRQISSCAFARSIIKTTTNSCARDYPCDFFNVRKASWPALLARKSLRAGLWCIGIWFLLCEHAWVVFSGRLLSSAPALTYRSRRAEEHSRRLPRESGGCEPMVSFVSLFLSVLTYHSLERLIPDAIRQAHIRNYRYIFGQSHSFVVANLTMLLTYDLRLRWNLQQHNFNVFKWCVSGSPNGFTPGSCCGKPWRHLRPHPWRLCIRSSRQGVFTSSNTSYTQTLIMHSRRFI